MLQKGETGRCILMSCAANQAARLDRGLRSFDDKYLQDSLAIYLIPVGYSLMIIIL